MEQIRGWIIFKLFLFIYIHVFKQNATNLGPKQSMGDARFKYLGLCVKAHGRITVKGINMAMVLLQERFVVLMKELFEKRVYILVFLKSYPYPFHEHLV